MVFNFGRQGGGTKMPPPPEIDESGRIKYLASEIFMILKRSFV